MNSSATTGRDALDDRSDRGARQRLARFFADREILPTTVRAMFDFYADTGVLSVSSLRVHRAVETTVEDMIDEAFVPVERAIAEEFGRVPGDVSFSYETKLTMPATLTLGHVHLQEDRTDVIETAEALTDLVVVALIDGDMRDALNDEEFEDFEVDVPVADDAERRRVAEIAQSTLQKEVQRRFEAFDDDVRRAYERAVEISEAHQDRDRHFRDLMQRAKDGDEDAVDQIREEYKFGSFEDCPDVFAEDDLDLPYLKTQFGRVGVIYDGMIDMYRAAGIEVDEAFETAIVLAIIGAQIWLDDVDDYERDRAATQLTPVTAEYLLEDSTAAAFDSILDATDQYFDAARAYAREADSVVVEISINYIQRSGSPENLPR